MADPEGSPLLPLFRNLAESSPGVMAVFHRRPDGTACMPYTSPRIWELYGLRSEDVVNDAEPFLARTHRDDDARLRESIVESARTMTPWRLEYRILHPTRGEVWIEGYSNPFPHPDGGVVWYGFLQEITDRKRAEEAAKGAEERLRLTFETVKIGTGELNLQTNLVSLTDPMRRVLGLPPGTVAISFEDYTKLVHPEDRGLVRREVEKSIAGQPTIALDFRIVWPDGSVHWVATRARTFFDEAGRATRIMGAIVDITKRRQAEDELRQATALFRAVIEGTTDLVTVKGRDGRYLLCNEATARAMGRSIAEVLGADDGFLFEPASAHVVRSHDQRVMESGVASSEEEELTAAATGIPRFFHVTKAPYRDEHGNAIGVIGIARDITTRKQADAALRESERKLAEAERVAHVGWWALDLDTGHFTWSDEAARILGHSTQNEWTFDGARKLVHPEDTAIYDAAMARVQHGESGFSIDYRIVRSNCEVRRLHTVIAENSARAHRGGRVLGVVQDVTEWKEAEQALRAAEQRLKHVVSSSPAVLFTLRAQDGAFRGIEWISPNIETMLGYRVEETLGSDWWLENIHPEDRAGVMNQFLGEILCNKHFTAEYRFRHKDGRYRWLRGETRLLCDTAGRPIEAVGSLSDITERKHLEEQFSQAQKMEAVGHLAGGVAHDFNNLLTIISGYSELMLADLAADHPLRASVGEIYKAGEHAATLTQQLLAFSRRQVLQPKVLDLNDVVADMEKLLRRLIGEDVILTVVPASALGLVKVDPGQVQQLLMNLAVNARDAMPQGGRLIIETQNITLDEAYVRSHPEVPPGSYSMLAVSDTGTGIDKATIARLFEPFFTTKAQGKGTGLGLAVVHGIVRQNRGHIEVYSEPGHGTTFKVYFPQVNEPMLQQESPAGLVTMPRGTETVLLVEDEKALRAFTGHVLRDCGYTVLEAENGEDALKVAADHASSIDLLVSDVVMPHLGGRELAERLAPLKPGLKVLFLSGYTEDAVVRHGVITAAVAFLQKPFTPSALARKVREVLDKST